MRAVGVTIIISISLLLSTGVGYGISCGAALLTGAIGWEPTTLFLPPVMLIIITVVVIVATPDWLGNWMYLQSNYKVQFIRLIVIFCFIIGVAGIVVAVLYGIMWESDELINFITHHPLIIAVPFAALGLVSAMVFIAWVEHHDVEEYRKERQRMQEKSKIISMIDEALEEKGGDKQQ